MEGRRDLTRLSAVQAIQVVGGYLLTYSSPNTHVVFNNDMHTLEYSQNRLEYVYCERIRVEGTPPNPCSSLVDPST